MADRSSSARGWWHIPARVLLIVISAFAVLAPVLRIAGILSWPWVLVLLPFTAFGALSAGAAAIVLLRPHLRSSDRDADEVTPVPERLEAPRAAKDAGDGVLVKHPELLAAVCHGFRKFRLQSTLLGHPVTDPWGVYSAVVAATPLEYEEFRVLVVRHAERLAETGRVRIGRKPSRSDVLKRAVKAFRKCSTRTEKGRGDLDCTCEHVTTIFGAHVPSRDGHLKTIAPKVRKLLEREYPQLNTAQLADGSLVKYADWQKQAAHDRRELARLRGALERAEGKLERTQGELTDARAQIDTLRDRADEQRQAARESARTEMQDAFEELRSRLDQERLESNRQLQRIELERDRLQATVAALSSERDSLERALFERDGEEGDGVGVAISAAELLGIRMLLVGGSEFQIPPIRDHLAGYGVQVLHQDGPAATERVAGVHLVILWIRYVSHPTALAVKRECRLRGVPVFYWTRTSPTSLIALLADARANVAMSDLDGSAGDR